MCKEHLVRQAEEHIAEKYFQNKDRDTRQKEKKKKVKYVYNNKK